MGKFSFRLQSYYNIQSQMEDRAKLELATAARTLEQASTEQARLEQVRGQNIQQLRHSLSGNVDPAQALAAQSYLGSLDGHIQNANTQLGSAKQQEQQRRTALTQATKQRKMLEKLHDNAKEAFHTEQQRAQQRTVDDMSSYKYNNQMKG